MRTKNRTKWEHDRLEVSSIIYLERQWITSTKENAEVQIRNEKLL